MEQDFAALGMEVVQGDICALDVDAIVNAANESLLGGGGVDGAIHRAAGPGLLAECRALGGCPAGEARITGGHRLRARHVIHTVGPVWRGAASTADRLLAACYRNALTLAVRHGIGSIAFPAISTGVYAFPPARAAGIAVASVAGFLVDAGQSRPQRVIFACFDADTAALYRDRLGGRAGAA